MVYISISFCGEIDWKRYGGLGEDDIRVDMENECCQTGGLYNLNDERD